jgi:hypothetical protein
LKFIPNRHVLRPKTLKFGDVHVLEEQVWRFAARFTWLNSAIEVDRLLDMHHEIAVSCQRLLVTLQSQRAFYVGFARLTGRQRTVHIPGSIVRELEF